MISFKNEVISSLPVFKDEDFIPIHKDYIKVILLNLLTFWFIGLLIIFVCHYFNWLYVSELKWLIYSIYNIFFLLFFVYYKKEFPKRSYLVREKDVTLKDGLFTRKIKTVPFARVQHVELNEKFFGRLFKLANLNIYTAGDFSKDLSIKGLEIEKANQIKAFISSKINE